MVVVAEYCRVAGDYVSHILHLRLGGDGHEADDGTDDADDAEVYGDDDVNGKVDDDSCCC